MPPASLDRITLTGSHRRALNRLVRAGRTEQRLATRARIVLAAADGQPNALIARSLRVCEDTVRKWRHRWWSAPGLASLADAPRSGRRPTFTAMQVAQVKAMACTPPDDAGLPLSRWSCPELAHQAIAAEASARRSRRPRSVGGSARTRSNPGADRGSSPPTRTSPPKPTACSTSTTENGTENRWGTTST